MNTNAFEKRRQTLISYQNYRQNLTKKEKIGSRITEILDKDSFTEIDRDLQTKDPLSFPGYKEKLQSMQKKTDAKDALICGTGLIDGRPVAIAQLDALFFMGSMGSVAGEKIARITEKAAKEKLPLIIISASGGARMQEGMFSLYQMAKTSAAIQKFKEGGNPFISVLTHPTTGGVSASFASLGDICIAEPGALIGFAGPRVIEQTIGKKLPEGFQSAQFQLEHGFVDIIVKRDNLRKTLAKILRLHNHPEKIREKALENKIESALRDSKKTKEKNPTAYERVLAARDLQRPKPADFINEIFEDFTELAGDRLAKEDSAIIGGIALLDGMPVTIIAHRKGKTTEENIKYNFGMPGPEGYRKAMRLLKQAEKFKRPVITFIDTPGAYPGPEAEENGQAAAIAESLAEMSSLKTPVISIVTGEGSSGGALAIGVADKVYMLENAVYSILSPEGFASILWKDAGKVKEACELMHLTADALYKDKITDGVIPEPDDFKELCQSIKNILKKNIEALEDLPPEELTKARYEKYRHFDGYLY